MALERLDRIISSQGMFSRKEAGKAIRDGRVTVNGKVIKDPSEKLDPASSGIAIDGKPFAYKKHIYLMLNKPAGVLSATTDSNSKTVLDLIPKVYKRNGLFPVGRLDKDTTGLMIITDDGDFAHKVISPKYGINKHYHAVVDGKITDEIIRTFATGVKLKDGFLCAPAELKVLDNGDNPLAEVVIKEGKYHQIKRMFAAAGLKVLALRRVKIGGLSLDNNLPEGECRELSKTEESLILRTDQ
ncbi:MAG TPA: rRNA pseudouridine synthase [Clostridiales bacterium]|nr:rRNA pseudouridine synthase [Clostridiales bacterium]